MNIREQFFSFQEKQFHQFLEFQKTQFQELLAMPNNDSQKGKGLRKSKKIHVIASIKSPIVVKPIKKVKRATNAYAFFTKEKRSEIKEANPEATFGEMAGHVSTAWKALTDEEKIPYVTLAEKDKIRVMEERKCLE